jgi:hypothetical protein
MPVFQPLSTARARECLLRSSLFCVVAAAVWEPTVAATVVTPNEFIGAIMQLCQVSISSQTRCHSPQGLAKACEECATPAVLLLLLLMSLHVLM